METVTTTIVDLAACLAAADPSHVRVTFAVVGQFRDGSPQLSISVQGPRVKEHNAALHEAKLDVNADYMRRLYRAILAKTKRLAAGEDSDWTLDVAGVLNATD